MGNKAVAEETRRLSFLKKFNGDQRRPSMLVFAEEAAQRKHEREEFERIMREQMEKELQKTEEQRKMELEEMEQKKEVITKRRRNSKQKITEVETLFKMENLASVATLKGAPSPSNEDIRWHALLDFQVLDTQTDLNFDRITNLASQLFNVPIAVVSLVDKYRQWFKSVVGLETRQTCRNVAFCSYTILLKDELLIVNDATQDPRFAENPLVTGAPYIRFYAGANLSVMFQGQQLNLGTLCIIDSKPRHDFDQRQQELLKSLASVVVRELEMHKNNANSVQMEKFKNSLYHFSQKTMSPCYTVKETVQLASVMVAEEIDVDYVHTVVPARPSSDCASIQLPQSNSTSLLSIPSGTARPRSTSLTNDSPLPLDLSANRRTLSSSSSSPAMLNNRRSSSLQITVEPPSASPCSDQKQTQTPCSPRPYVPEETQAASGFGWEITPEHFRFERGFAALGHPILVINNIEDYELSVEKENSSNSLSKIDLVMFLKKFNIKSAIIAGVTFEGETYGLVGVYKVETHYWASSEVNFLQDFANALAKSLARRMFIIRLEQEKHRADELLHNMLPRRVSTKLKAKETNIAEGCNASIIFADIVGFTVLSTVIPATELVTLLNHIFTNFDRLVQKHDLEKVKTIGDCYMAAAGLFSHEEDHAVAIVRFALDALDWMQTDSHLMRFENLAMRVGINSGRVICGVLGQMKYVYDIYGDPVNTASRMESHGIPGKVQISEATLKLIPKELIGTEFIVTERGRIKVKGKGRMKTFLISRANVTSPKLLAHLSLAPRLSTTVGASSSEEEQK